MNCVVGKTIAINALASLGLNLGESKVYTALYTHGTLEATPLADVAEVPQSKVYSYLSSLEKRGIVSKNTIEGKPNQYNAISYEQVILQLQNELNSKVDVIEDYFQTVSPIQTSTELPDFIRVMQGDIAVKNGLSEILNSTKENLFIIPNKKYSAMIQRLINKLDSIEIINYGDSIAEIVNFIPHVNPILQTKFQSFLEKGRPYIIFTDVDLNQGTASSANFILPPLEGVESIFFHFRHPTVVNFQFGMISTIIDFLESFAKLNKS